MGPYELLRKLGLDFFSGSATTSVNSSLTNLQGPPAHPRMFFSAFSSSTVSAARTTVSGRRSSILLPAS
jgi:hypothetical protein